MADPKDLYGTFGSVPDLSSQGSATFGQRLSVKASPNDFGAQIGEAQQYAGKVKQEIGDKALALATKYAAQDTEARVNDDWAKIYTPAAAELQSQYDTLQGQDKVAGYGKYVSDLQKLNETFVSRYKGYGLELSSKMANNRLESETLRAKSSLAATMKEFSQQAATDKILADSGFAVNNYNNPQIVESTIKSNSATIALNMIDQGYDPRNEDHSEMIANAQSLAVGDLASSMVDRAIKSNDVYEANKIRQKYGPQIPGQKQLILDDTLHRENMKVVGQQAVSSMKKGGSIPVSPGAPVPEVQATIVDRSKAHGVDANDMLTVAMIETSMGQNLGERGDIGQTGKGGDLTQQADNMIVEWKKAQDAARKALGRDPNGWETYLCYQQGVGGGAALLKALSDAPNANAVDTIASLYKTPSIARSAIKNNGGDIAMTTTDFAEFIKAKYMANAARAKCDFSQSEETVVNTNPAGGTVESKILTGSDGKRIIEAHTKQGVPVLEGATPRQNADNFNRKFPDMMAQAMAIPNYEMRAAVIQNLKAEKSNYDSVANAYSQQLLTQARQLMADENFTSMDQVPSDLYAELATESPQIISAMQSRAEANLNRVSVPPLDFTDPSSLALQLSTRVSQRSEGKPLDKLIRTQDRAALQETWKGMSPANQINFLNDLVLGNTDVEGKLNARNYADAVQLIRPDSPVTAIAGRMLSLDKTIDFKSENNWGIFAGDKFKQITPYDVATALVVGENLINPSKQDKETGGTAKPFPMPPDLNEFSDREGMVPAFNSRVGNLFRGTAGTTARSQLFQAFKAYYAYAASQRGVYDGSVNKQAADEAAAAILGNVTDINDYNVLPPWGMDSSSFADKAFVAWQQEMKNTGYDEDLINWNQVHLTNKFDANDPDLYRVETESGPLLDKSGNPLVIKVSY